MTSCVICMNVVHTSELLTRKFESFYIYSIHIRIDIVAICNSIIAAKSVCNVRNEGEKRKRKMLSYGAGKRRTTFKKY